MRAAGGWLGGLCMVLTACGGPELRVRTLELPSAGAGPHSADPALVAVPASGELVVGWIEGDGKTWSLHVARSRDAGSSWSSPARVAGGPEAAGEVHPHGESSPRLVAGPSRHLAAVWPNSFEVPGRKWPATMLRMSRSADGGRTWSEPRTLNDDTTAVPVSHQFHGAAWVGDSGLAVAWLDEREVAAPLASGSDGHAEHPTEPDATIYYTTSPDFGRTWAPNRVGWRRACPCCRVTLARGPQGRALAAWRKHYPGNVRDVVTSVIGDSSEPRRVHADEWSYPGCPHSGPAIASGADGTSHVVWYNGKSGAAGIYYAKVAPAGGPEPVGLVTGPAVGTAHPAVAALGDGGALAAYDVTASGGRRIGLARLDSSGSVTAQVDAPGSEGGKYPQLAVLDDSTAILAWTTGNDEGSEARLARVTLR